MRKGITFICILIMLGGFITCTIFKKEIKKPVVVKIVRPSNFASIKQNANYTKYVTSFSESDYEAKFVEGLTSEGKLTHNVTIDNEATNPDYIIEIKSLVVTESDFTQTISDPKSANNGKQFLLNKVECNGDVDCIDAKTNKKIGLSCSNIKSRQEKLKNNRDLGDLISGSNKDHSSYRQKALNNDIAKQLADDVGRRIWVPISKRIKKALK